MKNYFLPKYVIQIIKRIEQAGFEAWCVGGCVRDILLGKKPNDYDIATNAPCEKIISLFPRVFETGILHGTVTVVIDHHNIEVTRYRVDGEYSDHRRPDKVDFTDQFSLDLSRRDFTINAIGYHPLRGIFDPFGGVGDIKSGLIRAVGDPEVRFLEDALRIMRSFRFASCLGFKIDDSTFSAALRHAALLGKISAERVFSELCKTLAGENPSVIEPLIQSGGLASFTITYCKNLFPLDSVANSVPLRMAVLCLLCNAHASEVCAKLKSDKQLKTTADSIQNELQRPLPNSPASLKRGLARLSQFYWRDLLHARKVLFGENTDEQAAWLDSATQNREPYTVAMLDISGNDILSLSPDISGIKTGEILNHLLEFALENPQKNQRAILLREAEQFM